MQSCKINETVMRINKVQSMIKYLIDERMIARNVSTDLNAPPTSGFVGVGFSWSSIIALLSNMPSISANKGESTSAPTGGV
jgi:hypothetical protein